MSTGSWLHLVDFVFWSIVISHELLHFIADFCALCAHKTTSFMNNEYHTHRILFSHDRVLLFFFLPHFTMFGGIYIFYFLTKKWLPFVKKNPKRANPFWSFVYCTYSPLILLLGISHFSMPIFGTPPCLHPVRKKRTTIRSLAASKDVQKTAPKLKINTEQYSPATMDPRDQPQNW